MPTSKAKRFQMIRAKFIEVMSWRGPVSKERHTELIIEDVRRDTDITIKEANSMLLELLNDGILIAKPNGKVSLHQDSYVS